MVTANPKHDHQQTTRNENGDIVTEQIEPGEAQPTEPMAQWPWEEEISEVPASDDAGAPSTDAG
jgi:hypothetical protein